MCGVPVEDPRREWDRCRRACLLDCLDRVGDVSEPVGGRR